MVAWFAPFLTSVWWHIGKYEIKNIFSKSFKSLYFWLGIWVQGPYFDGKNTPHSLSMFITTSELCGFGIGFGIGRKYRPITVSVSVSGRNQNGGFGRSLSCTLQVHQCQTSGKGLLELLRQPLDNNLKYYWAHTLSMSETLAETIG